MTKILQCTAVPFPIPSYNCSASYSNKSIVTNQTEFRDATTSPKTGNLPSRLQVRFFFCAITLYVRFREPDGPEVELFDLDEALSSQRVRLAQITNRCRPDEITDLEVKIYEANYCYTLSLGAVPIKY